MRRVFAVWFIVQILLPFTAPLQTCDLADLLGYGGQQHGTPAAPESSSIPTTDTVGPFVSPVDADVLRASTMVVADMLTAAAKPVSPTIAPAPTPTLRSSVLRV